MRKAIKIIILIVVTLGLVSCGKSEEDQIVSEYKILDDYEFGGIKLTEDDSDLTPEEKAKKLVREEMGLKEEGEDLTYKQFGISEKNGLVISSLILEGPELPKVSAFSNEEISAINNKGGIDGVIYSSKFKEIIDGKKEKVSNYDEEDYEEYLKSKLTE